MGRWAILLRVVLGGLIRIALTFLLFDVRELQALHHLHSLLFEQLLLRLHIIITLNRRVSPVAVLGTISIQVEGRDATDCQDLLGDHRAESVMLILSRLGRHFFVGLMLLLFRPVIRVCDLTMIRRVALTAFKVF